MFARRALQRVCALFASVAVGSVQPGEYDVNTGHHVRFQMHLWDGKGVGAVAVVVQSCANVS